MSVNDQDCAAVVLLAAPGAARDKLRQAVVNAGGRIVLEAEPHQVQPAQVLGHAPAAVVLALDADFDDALDVLEPALAAAGVTLLLEEAELAAQREGWDAQRWERHLAAKLHGHANVLPPGAEEELRWQPDPGMPPAPALLHADARIEPHLDQACERVDSLPAADLALNDRGFDDAGFDYSAELATPDSEVAPSLEQLLAAMPGSAPPLVEAPGSGALNAPAPSAVVPPPLPPPLPAADAPAAPAQADVAAAPAPSLSQWSLVDFDDSAPVVADVPAAVAPGPAQWDLGNLSLVDLDADAEGAAPAAVVAEDRARAVVLLMAGIGGPDAIRRMLATLPAEGMPGAVLVQLRLDGGRYANLVTQLERVCPAPVVLAEAGHWLAAGHVYVMGDDTSVESLGDALRFATLPAGASVLGDLPAKGNAVIMLSGADADRVDAVIALAQHGAWVAGQSGEGCYDPAAASALAVAGMPIGEPAWLARELLSRWGL